MTTRRFPTAAAPLSLTAAVAALAPRLTPWVGAPLRDAVLREARLLPDVWRWGMFEVGLSAGDERCDLMACVTAEQGDAELVAAHLERPCFAPARELLEGWVRSDELRARLPIVWLEWDMAEHGAKSALASACLDASFWSDAPAPTRAEQLADLRWVAGGGLGSERRAAILGCVEDCVALLPEERSVLHVAPLAGRGLEAVRLTLGLRPAQLVGWLTAIDWPGDVELVRRWLEATTPPWQLAFFQIQMSERVEGYLGIETRTSFEAGAPFSERTTRALRELAGVDPRRLEALGAWTGEEGLGGETLARSRYVKVASFDGRLAAKGYLGFNLAEARRSAA